MKYRLNSLPSYRMSNIRRIFKPSLFHHFRAAGHRKRPIREDIRSIIHLSEEHEGNLTDAMAKFRLWVFADGMVDGIQGPDGPTIRPGIESGKIRE